MVRGMHHWWLLFLAAATCSFPLPPSLGRYYFSLTAREAPAKESSHYDGNGEDDGGLTMTTVMMMMMMMMMIDWLITTELVL